ncbi:MAG: sigma 54-interacting transcriptional regulator [Treponema sp.]|nr:sigma 54-interacting transcriptional regulator [Treponema sp.]
MDCRKVLIITDSEVLNSWCIEELRDNFSVSCISFRDCNFSEYGNRLSIFDCVDVILIDYSPEKEKCIVKLYDLFCDTSSLIKKRFVLIYDSYAYDVSNLKCFFSKAEFFNVISPVYSLKKNLSDCETLEMKSESPSYSSFYSPEVSMAEFEEKLKIVAGNDECVLLLGESGSGKSWAAKKIHQYSNRCKKKFFSVNVAEFNPNLIEGNLFGIASGAFTDAVVRKGWFEEANQGTLLLDEIGELPLLLQAKLLSVIENRIYKKLGSTTEYKFDEKLIFATNKNLEECVKMHTFRNDLFYRINCLTLYVPPLRNHKEDIPSLAMRFSSEHKKLLSQSAIEKLCNYYWPGNIRELKNVVMRACFFSRKETLTAEDIHFSYYA